MTDSYTPDIYGKIPPQAVEIESFVLGAMLVFKEAVDIAVATISHEVFYKTEHQILFKAIRTLNRKNQPVDILTVTQYLRETEELDTVGGPVYICQITDPVGGNAHMDYHLRILIQKYVQREFIRISSEVSKKAFDESIDIEDIFAYLNNEQDRLVKIIFSQAGSNYISYFIESSKQQYQERERRAKEGLAPGITTPVVDLTKTIGGWMNGDLVIIAGRPSMGKTAFALSAIRKAAKQEPG